MTGWYPAWQRVFNVGFRVVRTDSQLVANGSESIASEARPESESTFSAHLGTVLFTEHCSEEIAEPWRKLAGKWSFEQDTWRSTGGIIERGEAHWKDYTVSARVQKRDRIPCVLARVKDASNFYNLDITNGWLVLWKIVKGKWTKLDAK